MKRLLVVSMLSLALAGCAQSKGALSQGALLSAQSGGDAKPVPSIYDTINQGVGGKALAQTAMENPDDPQWAGRFQVSTAARPIAPGSPGFRQSSIGSPAAGATDSPWRRQMRTSIASGPMQSPGQAVGGAPAPSAASVSPAAMPMLKNQGSPSVAATLSMPAPADLPAPSRGHGSSGAAFRPADGLDGTNYPTLPACQRRM